MRGPHFQFGPIQSILRASGVMSDSMMLGAAPGKVRHAEPANLACYGKLFLAASQTSAPGLQVVFRCACVLGKPVSGFQLAAVDPGLVLVYEELTIGPAQEE